MQRGQERAILRVLAAEAFAPYSFRLAFPENQEQPGGLPRLPLGFRLVYGLLPFSSGLIGAPVLYVVLAPVHRWLTRWLPSRVAAGIVVLLGILLVLGPG